MGPIMTCDDPLSIPRVRAGERVELAYDPSRPEALSEPLLGLLVAQAMHDGLSSLSFEYRRPSGPLTLTYTGPTGDTSVVGEWPMTPPPDEMYPHLLQAALRHTSLAPGPPLRGTLAVSKDGKRLTLGFAADRIESFTLSWTDEAVA